MIPLSKPYVCVLGAPVLTQVPARFSPSRYYQNCWGCSSCQAACCNHGVDIDADNAERLLAAPEKFKKLGGVPPEQWFTDEIVPDAESPSARHRRTATR